MTSYYLIAAALGLGLAVAILHLVRRDHLYLRDGLFWIVVAVISVTLGLWPSLIDRLSGLVGIFYPPAFLFLVAIVVLVLRALKTDLAITGLKRDLRRINQKIALMDGEAAAAADSAMVGAPPQEE